MADDHGASLLHNSDSEFPSRLMQNQNVNA